LIAGHIHHRALAVDRDLARLHGVGHFAHQIDDEQPVGEARILHPHEVRQLEAALEIAIGNAEMQEFHAILIAVILLADDEQQVLLGGDVDFLGLEPRDGEGDAVAVLGQPLDIERRVIVRLLESGVVFDQVEQAVKPTVLRR